MYRVEIYLMHPLFSFKYKLKSESIMDELRQILERTILVAGVDGVKKMFLTDDREVNSEMLKSICDQIKDGS